MILFNNSKLTSRYSLPAIIQNIGQSITTNDEVDTTIINKVNDNAKEIEQSSSDYFIGSTNTFNVEDLAVRFGNYASFKIVLKRNLLNEVLNPVTCSEETQIVVEAVVNDHLINYKFINNSLSFEVSLLTKELTCSYQNVRGLDSKTSIFFNNFLVNFIKIICSTESWLLAGVFECELFPSNYKCDSD